MKKILVITFILTSIVFAQPKVTDFSSAPGRFSRLGFGARGISMGNAIGAVDMGNLSSYYNPALSAFQDEGFVMAGYSVLSLDRGLNFLGFTKSIKFYSGEIVRSTAGISGGVINSSVSKIEERDNQGNYIGDLSTSENQFYISFSNRFSSKFAVGVTLKYYYNSLYKDTHASTVGIDLGVLYKFNEYFNAAFILKDINSKYKWDTSPLYGQSGSTTENSFPVLKQLALSYYFERIKLLLAGEYEFSNFSSNIMKFGAEYTIYDNLNLRAGIDNLDMKNSDFPISPSAGFSYSYKINNTLTVGIDYAYQYEKYSLSDRHIINLNILF